MNRYENNKEILNIVSEYIEIHPEMRFIQALWALGIVNHDDRFYEEPEETLRRIKND